MKRIMCVNCKVIYEVKKYEKQLVKCGDCGCMYFQKDCDMNITILDCVKTK